MISFNKEEEAANQLLMDFMEQLREWGLNCNEGEMAHAIHTLQLFLIKHMLQRYNIEDFSEWFNTV